ncbi:prepilin peptidase [Marinomonas sp. 2405UD66-6]|uniref:prepilin peptidase n=1 Tax=Marinomonas sp. 2405UD66-6 TaxID=3391834 RepID=UPI0039C947BF
MTQLTTETQTFEHILVIVLVGVISITTGILLRVLCKLTIEPKHRSIYSHLSSVYSIKKAHFIPLELLILTMSLIVVCNSNLSLSSFMLLLLTRALITLSYIDIQQKLLPDSLTIPLLWLGILLNSGNFLVDLKDSVWGAIIGYASLWTMYWLYRLLTKKEGIGYGDLKLFAALGAWGGVSILLPTFVMASLCAALFSCFYAFLAKKSFKNTMAFGPYLSLFGWANILFIYLRY